MDGILVIDKPPSKTSHDIVNILRKATSIKKIGHTGTLDPMATGVLVVLIGRATRIGRFLELEPKEYLAEAVFGIVTDTQDITGKVLKKDNGKIALENLKAVIPEFTGEIYQVPPMVSAIKIGGKPLYKLARQGKEIERRKRKVSIYELDILSFFESEGRSHVTFKVVCSGGTYIRTLIHDIGERLGVGATLSSLRRVRVGRFTLAEAINIGDTTNRPKVASHLISMDDALSQLIEAVVQNNTVGLILNGHEIGGGQLETIQEPAKPGDYIRIKSKDKTLLAIGQILDKDGLRIKPKVVFREAK